MLGEMRQNNPVYANINAVRDGEADPQIGVGELIRQRSSPQRLEELYRSVRHSIKNLTVETGSYESPQVAP
jgi:hypothetical protein